MESRYMRIGGQLVEIPWPVGYLQQRDASAKLLLKMWLDIGKSE